MIDDVEAQSAHKFSLTEGNLTYVMDAPVEDVVQALASLNQHSRGRIARFFNEAWREANIQPIEQGYSILIERKEAGGEIIVVRARAEGYLYQRSAVKPLPSGMGI